MKIWNVYDNDNINKEKTDNRQWTIWYMNSRSVQEIPTGFGSNVLSSRRAYFPP